MSRLSVCVICCNEEAELPRCLDSVAFADELIVVVDAKSTDRSEAIVRERADRVEVRPYDGDIEQKSYCTSLATGDWILVIDPDEVMRPELAASVRAAVDQAATAVAGYEVDRLTWHLGRWIRHGDFYPDWTLRLFRAQGHRWSGLNPHGRIELGGGGAVARLGGELEHYSYRDIADHLDRTQRWSSQAALALHAAGRRTRSWDLALRPVWRFFRGYVLKRGFLDGAPGFAIAAVNAFYVFLKYTKLWDLARKASRG